MSGQESRVAPLALWLSLVLFGVPTGLLWLAVRWAMPALTEVLPGPDVLCWFIAGGSVFVLLFVAALVGFGLERRRSPSISFHQRFRLQRMTAAEVGWSLGTLAACGAATGAILLCWHALPLEEPNLSPDFLHMEPLTSGTYWVLLAWLPLFFFNIFGEELWWRGFILPRQERQHGRAAWVVHGVLLTIFHYPLGVDLLIVGLPFFFGLPWVVQRTQNLWTGIVVHALLNGGGFLAVALGLAG